METDLVARCRAGDESAWRELVERYSRYVHAIAIRGHGLSESDAEDVFQEVFARVWRNIDKIYDDEALRPWIGQATRRLSIDRIRSTRRATPTEPDALDAALPPVDARTDRIEQALDVHEALATLSADCREIVDRFFCRDETYETISEQLEIPKGTIASRISRCLGKLRERLAAPVT